MYIFLLTSYKDFIYKINLNETHIFFLNTIINFEIANKYFAIKELFNKEDVSMSILF